MSAPSEKWFVTSVDESWIIATPSGKSKKIGKVSKGSGINYFDRAMEEAARRNDDDERPRHCPGWQYEKTVLER